MLDKNKNLYYLDELSDYELDMFRQYFGDDTIDSTTLDDRFYNRKEFDSSLTRRKV